MIKLLMEFVSLYICIFLKLGRMIVTEPLLVAVAVQTSDCYLLKYVKDARGLTSPNALFIYICFPTGKASL